MSREDAAQAMIMIVGSFGVLLIPVSVGVLITMWNKMRDALNANTVAITEMKSRVDLMWEWTRDYPKMKRDVDAAHEKIRNRD